LNSAGGKVSLVALFGVIIFLSKAVLPTPLDKTVILVQGLLLALGGLIVGRLGAVYTAAIGGMLTALWRPGFAPFTLTFALLYGLTVDLSLTAFNLKSRKLLPVRRTMIALALPTAFLGVASMTAMVALGFMPMVLPFYLAILGIGTLNGVVAGYLTAVLWNKYLASYFYGGKT